MNKRFKSTLCFNAIHHPCHNNVYLLTPTPGADNRSCIMEQNAEIRLLAQYDYLEINLNLTFCKIYPVLEDGTACNPDIRFYWQHGNTYYGEHIHTKQAICAVIYNFIDNAVDNTADYIELLVYNERMGEMGQGCPHLFWEKASAQKRAFKNERLAHTCKQRS